VAAHDRTAPERDLAGKLIDLDWYVSIAAGRTTLLEQ
jgi:hypothetical protein